MEKTFKKVSEMAMFTALIAVIIILPISSSQDCKIPPVIQGLWFSYEKGRDVQTLIDEHSMTGKGYCLDVKQENNVNYTLVFKQDTENCYVCVKILVRTVNVVEKIETPCVTLPPAEASVENVCKDNVLADQQRTTLFEENYVPVNCRTSLEGVWQFSYKNVLRFAGDCKHPESVISACPAATNSSNFLVPNKKINITYKKCTGISGTFDDVIEYTCLGDWFVGQYHFFAVANAKESTKNKKYRCFLKHIDNDSYFGASITSECSTLKTVEKSPEKIHLTRAISELSIPNCTLPQNFSGEWIDTANLIADIFINTTHIIETWPPEEGRLQQIVYVCHQKQDTHYIMARHTFDGCKKSFICFEFVPRQENGIRYKRGIASVTDDFGIVCSWKQHKNRIINKYGLYLAKKPVPVHCPFTGRFNFTQQGDVLFETQISVGITLPLRPNIYCRQTISEFSVCERGHNKILIYVSHCLSVDYLGRPLNFYNDPDYTFKCIGFWKENDKSYLLTHDDHGTYQCWIYQRVGLNRILLSSAVGPFCDFNQRVTSSNYTEGATTALKLEEYDVGLDDDPCPLVFHDGSNPWMNPVNITSNVTMSNITVSNITMSNITMSNITMSNLTISNITELKITTDLPSYEMS